MPVQTRTKPALFDLAGRPLSLGSELGSGGEGAVYELRDRSDVVVKLYHKSLEAGKASKIVSMAKFSNERLLKLTAWPTEPIRVGSSTGAVAGFTMPRITGHKQAFSVCKCQLAVPDPERCKCCTSICGHSRGRSRNWRREPWQPICR
jgi:DNA-binding helix-hairpin-helix protein with protein kinase domain